MFHPLHLFGFSFPLSVFVRINAVVLPWFFKLLQLPLHRWGKLITSFLWHDLLLRLSGGLGIFYVVKWDLADNCCIRKQMWICLPMETVCKGTTKHWLCVFSRTESGGLLNWFEIFADSHTLAQVVVTLCLVSVQDCGFAVFVNWCQLKMAKSGLSIVWSLPTLPVMPD